MRATSKLLIYLQNLKSRYVNSRRERWYADRLVGEIMGIIVNLGKKIALRIPAYNRDRGTA